MCTNLRPRPPGVGTPISKLKVDRPLDLISAFNQHQFRTNDVSREQEDSNLHCEGVNVGLAFVLKRRFDVRASRLQITRFPADKAAEMAAPQTF
jgi:hypothetical protein